MLTLYSKCVSNQRVLPVYEDLLGQRETLVREARKGIKEEEVRRGEKDREGLKALWVHQEGAASKGLWDILAQKERKVRREMQARKVYWDRKVSQENRFLHHT